MLNALGNNADEVADSLRAKGIKGIRHAVRFLNPIVRYAHSMTPDAYGIDLILEIKLRIVFADGLTTEQPVPKAVLDFLVLFHQGHYPDLELPLGTG
jgi:hypothetical protein